MAEPVRSRTKWGARILALIAAALGVQLALQTRWTEGYSFFGIADSIITLVMITAAAGLLVFLCWLSVRLWISPQQKYFSLWALIPTILVGMKTVDWLSGCLVRLLARYNLADGPSADFEIALFVVFLVSGLIYYALRRLLFLLLDYKEVFNPVNFRKWRRFYLLGLSFCLWGTIIAMSTQITDKSELREHPWLPLAAFLIPFLIAIVFFRTCERLFVEKPLKALEQKPA